MDAVIVTFVILISIQPQIQNSLQALFLLLACLLAFSSLLFSSNLSLYLPLSISIHVVSIPILQKTLKKTLQTTLSIVSSVHHLTSSAIPHIFNVVERWLTNQNPLPSSSGIKQTGMYASHYAYTARSLLCERAAVPIGFIPSLIDNVRLSCFMLSSRLVVQAEDGSIQQGFSRHLKGQHMHMKEGKKKNNERRRNHLKHSSVASIESNV